MAAKTEAAAVRITVRGQVQGVGYRAWAHHQAELHGLGGWVRNRRDGSVEAVLHGPPDLIQAMLKACYDGPRSASVTEIDLEPATEEEVQLVPDGQFIVRDTV